jgi:hypothetical protein
LNASTGHPLPAKPIALDQIDAYRFGLAGLGVGANFVADSRIPGDLVTLAQCRHVEENVHAPVGRFDEAEAFFVVPHLNFAGWHTVLWVFHDFDLDPTVEKIAAVVEAAEREREDISAGIAQRANTRPATAIAISAMIASSNSFSAIEKGVRFLVLAPHVGQAIADVLIGPPHSLQVVIAIPEFPGRCV